MENKLALYGGSPVLPYKLNYSQSRLTKDNKKAVMDCLDGDWLAGRGKIVAEFEEAIAHYTGYKHAVAVNSATSGLHLALIILGYGEVTVPSLTFVATMNAALLAGCAVNVVDVDPDTYLLPKHHSVQSVAVSYAGYPLSQESIIYDDAHSLNKGMGIYSGARVSVISTHAIKPITTGEGGVVLTNGVWEEDFIRSLSDHGNGDTLYGHNMRMSSIQAALGLSQLESAYEMFLWRKEIAKIYRDGLAGLPVKLQQDSNSHSNHIFPVILSDRIPRDWFREALKAEGVLTQIHYEPLHLLAKKHVKGNEINISGDYPVAESIWYHGFSLPMHNAMTLKEARLVVEAMQKIFDYVEKET